jgi:iron complex outermembrane receptor protein
LASSALADLGIEELMNVSVTSVSKKAEPLADAASAISVITQEDLQRSGAKSIPEALRLVPGMDVAQLSASSWAISARGFQGEFANKLLVLMDGRSVYTPSFSGVFWDVQDTLMEDIERIEVIRGPGAAVWGANAVNGVVNIITKGSQETQGGLATLSGGSELNVAAAGRYGGKINDEAFYRIYGKYDLYDHLDHSSTSNSDDGWNVIRSGFRVDWLPTEAVTGTLQGDTYYGEGDDQTEVEGGNVLGRWTRTLSETSQLSVQAYYDRTFRDTTMKVESRDTADLDIQHNFAWGERQSIVWGGEYQFTSDHLYGHSTGSDGGNSMSFDPDRLDANTFSAFVQDTVSLIQDRLALTLGSKIEHNDYTGMEYQPSVRLAWKPTHRQTVWGAISRAVRTPNRYDTASTPREGGGGLTGNPDLLSEVLWAYELGYRIEPTSSLSIDLATFFNDYDRLVGIVSESDSSSPTSGGGPTSGSSSAGDKGEDGVSTFKNNIPGYSYGGEISLTWKPVYNWRLTAFYSYIHGVFDVPESTRSVVTLDAPQNQVGLRSSLDLGRNWQFDVVGRFVDEWRSQDVPAYFTCDARLAWSPSPRLQISLVGQNLVEDYHREASSTREIPRSVYAKVTVNF